MSNPRSLAALLALMEEKNSGLVLRIPETEKDHIKQLADQLGMNISDFVRAAIYYFAWATGNIELKVHAINQTPEYIDLQNIANYSVYLCNYLVADDTFDPTGARTNKHRHSFHFGPLVFNFVTGKRDMAVLHPQEIIRIYSQQPPDSPPFGVSVWTSLGLRQDIWNNQKDRISVYRIARKDSEDIIAGIPSRRLGGLASFLNSLK